MFWYRVEPKMGLTDANAVSNHWFPSATGQPPFAQFPPAAAPPPTPSLPADVSTELADVLEKLTGTKESIKGTKAWFMERSAVHLTGMVGALRDRVLNLEEVDKQLHVIYLVNDILFSW